MNAQINATVTPSPAVKGLAYAVAEQLPNMALTDIVKVLAAVESKLKEPLK